jgi:CheY-like chemotaxis protein
MRVLIVEDHPDVAESLAELMKLAGCLEVAIAPDAKAGLLQMRNGAVDMVLCDLTLPGEMDGLDLAEACRADPSMRHLRLLAMSGYCTDDDRRRALAAGFDELLAKPVGFDTLSDLLRR